jgi:hypothetical protein
MQRRQGALSAPEKVGRQGAELRANFQLTKPGEVDGQQATAPEKGGGARS